MVQDIIWEIMIILINGEELADFMFDYNLGMSEDSVYFVKKIDEDFFGE